MLRIILYAVLIYIVYLMVRFFIKGMQNQARIKREKQAEHDRIDTSQTEDADFEEIK